MSKALLGAKHYWKDEDRLTWQVDRGPRYGNERRLRARMKVKKNRADRHNSSYRPSEDDLEYHESFA